VTTSTITGRVKPRIEIAPGANPAGDPSLWPWLDAGKRRQKVDISITGGRDDEANEVEAGSLGVTMDNRDGRLSPRNILGPYYGSLGSGTPLRAVLDRVDDPFTRTVASGWGTTPEGFTWTVSNGTAAVNGAQATWAGAVNNATRNVAVDAGSPDVEVVWSTTLDVMPTGASFVSAALLRHTDASNYIRAHVELQAAGTVAVKVQRLYKGAQSDLLGLTATAVTYSAGTKVWGKARADGPYILVKTWLGALTDEPAGWQGVATDDSVEGIGTGWFGWRINTNVGTYTAKIDDVTITNLLWSGNVPEWPPKWPEKSGTDSTMPLAAAGILRRLGQGSSPVKSPLRQQLGAMPDRGITTFAYYPLEEAAGAQQALEARGGKPLSFFDVSFGADDTLNGSAPTAKLNTGASSIINVPIPSVSASGVNDGFACLWFFRMDTLPSISTEMVEIKCAGTMVRFEVLVDATTIQWNAYDSSNTLIANSGAVVYAVDPTQWVAMQMETNVSGGTVTVSLIWHQVGSQTFYVLNDTYSGTSIRPTHFGMISGSDNWSAAHLWFGDNDLPFVDTTFMLVADGYRTELAADRVRRLCRDNNVPVYVLAGATEPMGRQPLGKLVDLLRECEAADQAILCERGNALMFIPRLRRYNPPVALALDWSLGHLDEAPEPVDDDQRLRNLITVSRTNGSSVTATDTASIARSGTYDQTEEINIAYDSRLSDFANWLLNIGTANYLRWPRIKINLLAHPEFIPFWLSCRLGSRITIANPPSTQLAGEVVDVVIEGWSQTINNYKWEVELSCSPAQPWLIGAYDSSTSRYDVDSYLELALDGDDTLASIVAVTRDGFWSSASVPYDVKVSGQINRVVGMSLPDSVALADGTFEAGLGAWQGFGGTISLDSSIAHTGSKSAKLVVSGSPSQALIRPSSVTLPSAPGRTYTASMWVYCSVSRTVTAVIDFYNGASYISSAFNAVAVTANTWTLISVNSGSAPATTTRIEYGPTMGSSPANGTTLNTDDIDIVRTDIQNWRQLGTLTRGVDGFTKALPANASVRLATTSRYGL
jgi:hypothetical protein